MQQRRLPRVIAVALALLPLVSCAGDRELGFQNSIGPTTNQIPISITQ